MSRKAGTIFVKAYKIPGQQAAGISWKKGVDPEREKKALKKHIEARGGRWDLMKHNLLFLDPFIVHIVLVPSINLEALRRLLKTWYDNRQPPFDTEPDLERSS